MDASCGSALDRSPGLGRPGRRAPARQGRRGGRGRARGWDRRSAVGGGCTGRGVLVDLGDDRCGTGRSGRRTLVDRVLVRAVGLGVSLPRVPQVGGGRNGRPPPLAPGLWRRSGRIDHAEQDSGHVGYRPVPDVPPRAALAAASSMAIDDLLAGVPSCSTSPTGSAAAGHEVALVGGSVRDALLAGWARISTSPPPPGRSRSRRCSPAGPTRSGTSASRSAPSVPAGRATDFEITTYRSPRSYDPQLPQARGHLRRHAGGGPASARLHGQRDGRHAAGAVVRRPPRRAGPTWPPGPAHPCDARGVVLRRPAAHDAGGAVRRPAAVHRRTRGRRAAMAGHGRADRDRVGRAGPRRARRSCSWPRSRARAWSCWSPPGLAGHVLPELPALRLEIDEHHRHKDVYEHSLTVLEQAIDLKTAHEPATGPDLVLRLAALLHDIGKPRTRRFEGGGRVSFHHHEVVGAKMARQPAAGALRYPQGRGRRTWLDLVELHLRFHGYGQRRVDRFARCAATCATPRTSSSGCTSSPARTAPRATAQGGGAGAAPTTTSSAASPSSPQAEELAAIRPDLDGTQIMGILGIPPGPRGRRGLPLPARAPPRRGPAGPRARRGRAAGLVGRAPSRARAA